MARSLLRSRSQRRTVHAPPARRSLPVLLGAALALGACADAGPDPAAERVGEAPDPIINGSPDTSHQAVVTVAGGNSVCSGTIVHKNGSTGFVLTAAHCGSPQYIIQANDYNDPNAIVYAVTDFQRHPNYNGAVYDFMMVTFTGAGSGTPVIPAMSPSEDNLTSGTQVRHVGYGLAGPPPGSNNSVRRQIVGTLSYVSSLLIEYNQPNGGPCSGDSGGPQLTLTTPERVAGVTSQGDANCAGYGESGRVSAVYDSFVMAYINNTPIGNMTCDQCLQASTSGQGACVGAVNACFDNASCAALVQCLNNCPSGDTSCVNSCANQHASGISLYNAIFECVCDTGCASECASDPMCQSGTSTGAGAATVGAGPGAGGSTGAGEPAGAGGAGASAAGGDGWVAGEAQRRDVDGDVLVSSCAVDGGGKHRRGSARWLLPLAAAWLALRRRKLGS